MSIFHVSSAWKKYLDITKDKLAKKEVTFVLLKDLEAQNCLVGHGVKKFKPGNLFSVHDLRIFIEFSIAI